MSSDKTMYKKTIPHLNLSFAFISVLYVVFGKYKRLKWYPLTTVKYQVSEQKYQI